MLEEWISLDGYVVDRKGQLDFFTSLVRPTYAEADQTVFLETIDTILLGRKTYEQFVTTWPDRPVDQDVLARKMNSSRKIVFSNTLTAAPWGKWPDATIASGDAVSHVRQLKSQPGANMVLWASISLAQDLMKEDLIDEYHLFLCPAITAGGRKLFTEEMDVARLQLLETRQYGSGVVWLNYRPAGRS